MRLRLFRTVLILTVGIMTILAALVLVRLPLAEALIEWQMRQQGFKNPGVEVTALDLDHIQLSNISIPGAATVTEATITYQLTKGRIDSVRVRGAEVLVGFVDGELDLGQFTGFGKGDDRPSGNPSALPAVHLSETRVRLRTDHGLLIAHLPGEIMLTAEGLITVDTALELNHPNLTGTGRVTSTAGLDGNASVETRFASLLVRDADRRVDLKSLAINADIQPDFINLDIAADVPDIAAAISVQAAVDGPFTQPLVDMGAELHLGDLSKLSQFLPDQTFNGGAVMINAALSGVANTSYLDDLPALIRSVSADFSIALEGDVRPIDGIASAATLSLGLNGSITDNNASVHLEEVHAVVKKPAEALVPKALLRDGPVPLVGQKVEVATDDQISIDITGLDRLPDIQNHPVVSATGGLVIRSLAGVAVSFRNARIAPETAFIENLAIRASDLMVADQKLSELALSGRLSLTPEPGFTGTIVAKAPALRFDDLLARDLDVRGTFAAESKSTGVRLNISDLLVRHGPVDMTSDYQLSPGQFSIAGTLDATPCNPDSCNPRPLGARATIQSATIDAQIRDVTAHPTLKTLRIELTADPATFNGSGAVRTDTTIAALEFGDLVTVRQVSMKGTADPGSLQVDQMISAKGISIGEAIYPGLPEISLNALLKGNPDDLDIDGTLALLNTRIPQISISGDLGQLDMAIPPFNPTHLFTLARNANPDLPDIKGLSGTLEINASHHVAEGRTAASISIQDGGATLETLRVTGIEAVLDIFSLAPLSTAGSQQIRIAELEAGIPLRNIDWRYRISGPTEAAVLDTTALTLNMLDGKGSFEPFSVIPTSGDADLTLNLQNIDLELAAEAMGIDGVSAKGRLTGRLPFRIRDQSQIAIEGGKLSSTGPGVLRLPTPLIQELLGGQIDVRLLDALTALADFHFSTLSLNIDKAFDGDARILARIEGSNPEHLNGQPYILNVNVTGNADRLVDTILTVYRASTGALQSGVKRLK